MKGNASFFFNRVAAARTQLQWTDAMIIPTEYEQRQRQRFMFVNPWISSHSTLSRRWKLRKVKSEATRRIHKAKRNEIRTRSDVSYSLTTWSTRKRTRRRKSVPRKTEQMTSSGWKTTAPAIPLPTPMSPTVNASDVYQLLTSSISCGQFSQG